MSNPTILTLDFVRSALKADGDDDAQITQYMASARTACEAFCNRSIYDTQEELDEDFDAAMEDYRAAKTGREGALANTTASDEIEMIENRFLIKAASCKKRMNGIVIDDNINAAILMLTGHFYRNRQEVIASQYAPAQVPIGAQEILKPYLWLGDFGGGS